MSIDTERGSLNEGYYAILKADSEQDKELSAFMGVILSAVFFKNISQSKILRRSL